VVQLSGKHFGRDGVFSMGAPMLLGGGAFEIDRHIDTLEADKATARRAECTALAIAAEVATALRNKGYQAFSPKCSNKVDAALQCIFDDGRYVDLGIVLEGTVGNVAKFLLLPFGFRRKKDATLFEKLADDWTKLAPIVEQVVTDNFGSGPITWLTPREVNARCAVARPQTSGGTT
jgi:hypothetical protein